MERKGTWQPTRNGGAVFVPERAPEAPKGNPGAWPDPCEHLDHAGMAYCSGEVAAMVDVLAEHCIDQVEHHNEGVTAAQQLSVHDKQLLYVSVAHRLKEAADALNDL